MKSLIIVLVLMSVLSTNGCLSYMSYQASKNEIAKERIIASGNVEAIKAVKQGADPVNALQLIPIDNGRGVVLALDVSDIPSMKAIAKHPVRATGAAVGDAIIGYGLKLGVDALTDSNDNKSDVPIITINGNENNSTVIIGDGNGSNGSPQYDSENTGM